MGINTIIASIIMFMAFIILFGLYTEAWESDGVDFGAQVDTSQPVIYTQFDSIGFGAQVDTSQPVIYTQFDSIGFGAQVVIKPNYIVYSSVSYGCFVNLSQGTSGSSNYSEYWEFYALCNRYDVTASGGVDSADRGAVWLHRTALDDYNYLYDVSGDGTQVDSADRGLVWSHRGESCS